MNQEQFDLIIKQLKGKYEKSLEEIYNKYGKGYDDQYIDGQAYQLREIVGDLEELLKWLHKKNIIFIMQSVNYL